MQLTDRILTCGTCGVDFIFTIEEQRELVLNGMVPRGSCCSSCRVKSGVDSECEGQVKWFDNRKGYGFIEWDGGEDLFVHYSSIRGQGFRTLDEGEKVRFRVEEGDKGLQAQDVIRVSDIPSTFSFYTTIRITHL